MLCCLKNAYYATTLSKSRTEMETMNKYLRHAKLSLESYPKPMIIFKGVAIEEFTQDEIIKILGLMQKAQISSHVVSPEAEFVVGSQVWHKGEVGVIKQLDLVEDNKVMAWVRMFGQSNVEHIVNTKLLELYEGDPRDNV